MLVYKEDKLVQAVKGFADVSSLSVSSRSGSQCEIEIALQKRESEVRETGVRIGPVWMGGWRFGARVAVEQEKRVKPNCPAKAPAKEKKEEANQSTTLPSFLRPPPSLQSLIGNIGGGGGGQQQQHQQQQ